MSDTPKTFEESIGVTQPVIFVGVSRQEALGFHHVTLIQEDENGVRLLETHLHGASVSVQMVNGTLMVFVKTQGKFLKPESMLLT